jgi:hypothetical protein
MSKRASLVLWTIAAASCLSSSPPAPPVRWFDPSSAAAESPATSGVPVDVRVTARPHLGREFLVRIGEHEIAIDDGNAWIAEPRELVATAIARRLPPGPAPAGRSLAIEVEAFELDVRAEPRAVVRVNLRGLGLDQTLAARGPAGDRSPESLAASMATALEEIATDVASLAASAGR